MNYPWLDEYLLSGLVLGGLSKKMQREIEEKC